VWPARLSPNSDIARLRITVFTASRGLLIREGTGAGHGIDVDLSQAHESAIKEAETDAMKRALVTFGARFGLSLYDRNQRPMSGPVPQAARPLGAPSQAPANGVVRRLPPAQAQPAQAAPAPDAPLDPPTIRSLHERIRGMLPPSWRPSPRPSAVPSRCRQKSPPLRS
jgi:hypothetical protein